MPAPSSPGDTRPNAYSRLNAPSRAVSSSLVVATPRRWTRAGAARWWLTSRAWSCRRSGRCRRAQQRVSSPWRRGSASPPDDLTSTSTYAPPGESELRGDRCDTATQRSRARRIKTTPRDCVQQLVSFAVLLFFFFFLESRVHKKNKKSNNNVLIVCFFSCRGPPSCGFYGEALGEGGDDGLDALKGRGGGREALRRARPQRLDRAPGDAHRGRVF